MPRLRGYSEPFLVTNGKKFNLDDIDPSAMPSQFESEAAAQEALASGLAALSDLQDKLYAQNEWGLLVVLQGMDAAGKDMAVKHVFSGLNPQGCDVHPFKAPSTEELDHDFLWRSSQRLPERGRIGVFNRSYYEEVLVARVHRDILKHQQLPQQLIGKKIWKERYEDINAFERYLTRNGILVLKFFLYVSNGEQRRRLLSRLDEPEKNWKFSLNDPKERVYWDDYMKAYEKAIRATATPFAPWYVVPADNKWWAHLIITDAIVASLESLKLAYPVPDARHRAELRAVRKTLDKS